MYNSLQLCTPHVLLISWKTCWMPLGNTMPHVLGDGVQKAEAIHHRPRQFLLVVARLHRAINIVHRWRWHPPLDPAQTKQPKPTRQLAICWISQTNRQDFVWPRRGPSWSGLFCPWIFLGLRGFPFSSCPCMGIEVKKLAVIWLAHCDQSLQGFQLIVL